MRFISKLIISAIFTGVVSPFVMAADFTLEPRAVLGMMDYQYEEVFAGSDNVKWSDSIPFLGIGVTLGYKNFSFDVYAQKSDTGEDSTFYENQLSIGDRYLISDYNATFNRNDYAVNFGYSTDSLFGVLSFVVGYKVGETKIGGARRNYLSEGGDSSILSLRSETTTIKTKGPTIGVAYGLPVGKSSMIGINVAYAWLDGDYESNQMTLAIDPEAITFGINWSGPISNRLTYRIALDAYQYPTQAFSTDNPNITIESIKEEIVSLKASLSYKFDL